MARRKLQVFVSSTFTDLRDERQAAVEVILLAGHLPAGMELFGADDKQQMEVIRGWIADSDVFLILLAGRYGSIDKATGKSYTHLEYEHAISLGKPVLAMVMQDDVIEARGRENLAFVERDSGGLLRSFRETVKDGRLVSFFHGIDNLKLQIMVALSNADRRDDLVGWVRGDEIVSAAGAAEAFNQVALLTKENAALRATNEELKAIVEKVQIPTIHPRAEAPTEFHVEMKWGDPIKVTTTYFACFRQIGRLFVYGLIFGDVLDPVANFLMHLAGRAFEEVSNSNFIQVTADIVGAFGLFGWIETREVEGKFGFGRTGPETAYFLTDLGEMVLLAPAETG